MRLMVDRNQLMEQGQSALLASITHQPSPITRTGGAP